MDTRLTARQRMFVAEYLVDLNATQAAIRAGYSKRSAVQVGYENLRKPDIQAAIEETVAQREKRLEVTADAVIKELASIAFANITDYLVIGEGGTIALRNPARVDGRALADFQEVRTAQGLRRTVRLHDKLKALELLGKHLGLFTEKVAVSTDHSLADLLARARQRQLARQTAGSSEQD